MGRKRRFDEGEMLDRAVACFWAHGYGATSVRDLEAAMEMSSASFYNAFGGKRALFRRALQRYLDKSTRQRIAVLDASGDPRGAIEALLEAIIEASATSRNGCLLINSAAEVAAHDDDLRADVAAGLQEIEDALQRTVLRAQADGSVSSRLSAASLARALLGAIVSIRVMSRTAPGADYLRALAGSPVALLSAPPVGGTLACESASGTG